MLLNHDDMKLLTNELGEVILHQNMCLSEAINKINTILKHAVALLHEDFTKEMSFNQSIEQNVRTHTPVEGLLTVLQKALHIAGQLSQLLDNTTRSLQVEDIISQIANQIIKRSLDINALVNEILEMINSSQLYDSNEVKQMINKIKLLKDSPYITSLEQTSLKEGEIDIF